MFAALELFPELSTWRDVKFWRRLVSFSNGLDVGYRASRHAAEAQSRNA